MPAVSECHGGSLVSMENGKWLKCAVCQQPCEGISDEHDDEFPSPDQLSAEIDRRKIQALIDSGQLDPEMVQNAPIVEMTPCTQGMHVHKVMRVTCQWQGECGRIFADLAKFEEHLALDHMGLTKTGDD